MNSGLEKVDYNGLMLKPYKGFAIEKTWAVSRLTGEKIKGSTSYCAYDVDENGEVDDSGVVDCAASLADFKRKLQEYVH